jgi:hypothetical protein
VTSQLDPLYTDTEEDIASTEDEEVNKAMEEEISAETTETMWNRYTAARTAKWTIIPQKAVAFLNDSTADAEALTDRRMRMYSASTFETLAIRQPNAKVGNGVSKPKTRATNKALKTLWQKEIWHWHSMECGLVIEFYTDYQTPFTLQLLHHQLHHFRRGW